MRQTALKKAKKYYSKYNHAPGQESDSTSDNLEIAIFYFSIYIIRLLVDIETHFKFEFIIQKKVKKSRKEIIIFVPTPEPYYYGVPLQENWLCWNTENKKEKLVPNPLYGSSISLFADEEIRKALERLVSNYRKDIMTSFLKKDNIDSFQWGLKIFTNGLKESNKQGLSSFSFLFVRCRNHLIHAGKRAEDRRDRDIMYDMCTVLYRYTMALETEWQAVVKES